MSKTQSAINLLIGRQNGLRNYLATASNIEPKVQALMEEDIAFIQVVMETLTVQRSQAEAL